VAAKVNLRGLNFTKLAEIVEGLDVEEKDIVNYQNDVYNQTVQDNGHGYQDSHHTNNIYHVDKELFEKSLKDKDAEIAFFKGIGGKGEWNKGKSVYTHIKHIECSQTQFKDFSYFVFSNSIPFKDIYSKIYFIFYKYAIIKTMK
jgi:hypothetical protein